MMRNGLVIRHLMADLKSSPGGSFALRARETIPDGGITLLGESLGQDCKFARWREEVAKL
jgi:hypothetical protein